MGQLDQISEAIGGLRAKFDSLDKGIIENRRVADCRHQENQTRLKTIETALASLSSDRRVAVIFISTITGGIMWVLSHLLPFLFKKWQ